MYKRRLGTVLATLGVLAVTCSGQPSRLLETYSNLPLRFEASEGQVAFTAHGGRYSLFLTPAEAVLALQRTSVRMKIAGANPAAPVAGVDELPGTVNYFIGNDPQKWRNNVRSFAKVRYQEVYPGVDLIYYGNQRQLEYDFVVAPGADPRSIALDIQGADRTRIDRQGDLVLKVPDGEVRFHKPLVYLQDPERTPVSGRYVLRGKRVRFELAAYDRSKTLVIDPVVTYATYLGGAKDFAGQPAGTDGFGIAVDPGGNIYVTGSTNAVQGFPVTANAFQSTPPDPNYTNCPTGFDGNVFVAKLSPAGIPVYITYLGGPNNCNQGLAVAGDASGNALVTGWTESNNFPTPGCSFQCTKPNGGTATAGFLTKFNSSGGITYSTYIAPGPAGSVTVDAAGNAYLTGDTDATFTKTTTGAYRTTCASRDTYIVKLSPAGTAIFASCLGSNTGGNSIALDPGGNIYVSGSVTAPTGFAVLNGFQTTIAGGVDGYLAELNPSGSSLLYSTFFGGSGTDDVTGVAADGVGNAYIVGNTGSFNLPVTSPLYKSPCVPSNFACTGFVAKFNTLAAGATSLVFATYLGGSSGDDAAQGVAVDNAGNGYVTGFTASSNFPTVNPIYGCQGCASSNESMFVTEFSPAGAILFSTFLGGSTTDSDEAFSVALDTQGAIYLTGTAGSNNLPPALPIPGCLNPVQSTPVSNFVAFVLRLSGGAGSGLATSTTAISSANPSVAGQSVTFTATVSSGSGVCGTLPGGSVTFRDGSQTLGVVPLTNGQASLPPTSTLTVGSHSITATYNGDSSFTGSASAPLIQQVLAPAPPIVSTQPLSQIACAGQNVTFTAAASGAPAPSVQWQVSVSNGPFTNIPGATLPTLSFPASAAQDGNQYRAVFTNLAGMAVTNPALLTVNTPPLVTLNPTSQTVNSGQSVTFTAAAIGKPAPAVQWQVSVNNGPFTNIPGANSSSLTFTADSSQNTNQYRAVFTDPCGAANTTAAALTVNIVIQVNESIKVTDSPAANNTSSGNNVVIKPVDTTSGTSPVTLTFTTVTQPGLTSLTTSSNGPPPPTGFQLGNPAEYYNLTTTATFTGTILVCINYTGISFVTPPGPRLFHFENGSWVDRTVSVDTTNMIVCGSVTSLSPFALFRRVDIIPPTTRATLVPPANAAGWNNSDVTVTLTSTDDEPRGSGVKQVTYSASGAQTIAKTVVPGVSASFTINVEGVTTITFFGTDNAGNIEAPQSLTIKLDKTPPRITCSANPSQLWPPDNKLATINVSVAVTDTLSRPAGFTLLSVTSNEPDSGAGDIQGWTVGTASTTGQLRAQRLGEGNGRVYTLTYRGADEAGNTATCASTVTVPHDQGNP